MNVDWSGLSELAARASPEDDLYNLQRQAGLSYTRRQTAAFESASHAQEVQSIVAGTGGGYIDICHAAQETGNYLSRAAAERIIGTIGPNA